MATNLRTQAGPWCGGLTDTSVQIRASVLRSVATARIIVAENEALSVNPTIFPAASMWSDPERKYRHRIATFNPQGLRPTTDYFFRLEIDGDTTKAIPGRFRTAPPLNTPGGFRFALSGCARPRFLFGGVRPEAYKAIAAMKDLLFFFHLGDFHYQNIGDKSVEPRLEAYDDTLRREGVGDLFRDLPIAYCRDDHDFLGNNSDGGDRTMRSGAASLAMPTTCTCRTIPWRRRPRGSTSPFRSDACCSSSPTAATRNRPQEALARAAKRCSA